MFKSIGIYFVSYLVLFSEISGELDNNESEKDGGREGKGKAKNI